MFVAVYNSAIMDRRENGLVTMIYCDPNTFSACIAYIVFVKPATVCCLNKEMQNIWRIC